MRTPTSRTEARGFTLIELCVVIAIIGILTALVFVRIDAAIPRQRLRTATSEIIGSVRLARATARLWRSEVFIEYDLDGRAWTVSAVPPPREDGEGQQTAGAEVEVMFSGSLPEEIKIQTVHYSESGIAISGTVTASFRPSGAVGEHMVILESASAGVLGVYVPGLLGEPFLVRDGSSYGEIRAQRRLQ